MILTNFLWNDAKETTHTLLSQKVPESLKKKILDRLVKSGANAINIYLCNEGDYGRQIVCPYKRDKWFGVELDLAKLDYWEAALQVCLGLGLHPILWLFADDSPTIAQAWKKDKQSVANIIMYLAQRFDKYALAWVLGLEVNEWASRADSDLYGSVLAHSVGRPCGVHQTTGRWDFAQSPWAYFAMLQYGFGKNKHTANTSDVQSMTRRAISELGKPVIACEYSRYGDSKQARECGQAAIAAGAVGVCNGF